MGEVQFVTGERPAEKQPAGERTSCPARNSLLSIKAASVRKERTTREEEHGEEEESSMLTALQHQREANHTCNLPDYEGRASRTLQGLGD